MSEDIAVSEEDFYKEINERDSVKRSEDVGYFAIIPAPVRYSRTLTSTAKLLYGEINSLSHKENYCYASNSYFADIYDISKDRVSKLIASLEKENFISIKLIRDENKQILERRITCLCDDKAKITKGSGKKNYTPMGENDKDNNLDNNKNNNNSSDSLRSSQTTIQLSDKERKAIALNLGELYTGEKEINAKFLSKIQDEFGLRHINDAFYGTDIVYEKGELIRLNNDKGEQISQNSDDMTEGSDMAGKEKERVPQKEREAAPAPECHQTHEEGSGEDGTEKLSNFTSGSKSDDSEAFSSLGMTKGSSYEADHKPPKKARKTTKKAKAVKTWEEMSVYEKIHAKYVENFNELKSLGKLSEEVPVYTFARTNKRIKDLLESYTEEQIIGAVEESILDDWLVGQKYPIGYILGPAMLPKLINARAERLRKEEKKAMQNIKIVTEIPKCKVCGMDLDAFGKCPFCNM